MKISKKGSKVPSDPAMPPQTEESNSKVEKPSDNKAKWTYRFLIVSIIQGAIATFLTILLAAFIITTPYAKHLVSIFLDNASTGFMEITALAGLGVYFLIGVIGNGVSSFIYHYLEIHLKRSFNGLLGILPWCHIIITNIGITSVSFLMIYAGYIGDTAMFPTNIGGFGMTSEQVSQNILNHFIIPIGVLLIVTTTGAICGGIGFISAFIKR
ncbi:hypothetical protein [Candidatus Nitrosocosmicus sp. T]